MKCSVTVRNMSVNDDDELKFVVVRITEGEAWYWGSWSSRDTAERVAKELGNAIVVERE